MIVQVSQVDVVPKILIASQGGKKGGSPRTGNVMEALLTLMMSERLGGDAGAMDVVRPERVVAGRFQSFHQGLDRYQVLGQQAWGSRHRLRLLPTRA